MVWSREAMAWVLWLQVLPQGAGLEEHPAEQCVQHCHCEKWWKQMCFPDVVPKDNACEKVSVPCGMSENYSYALACSFLLLYPRGLEEELTACKKKKNTPIFAFVFLQSWGEIFWIRQGMEIGTWKMPSWARPVVCLFLFLFLTVAMGKVVKEEHGMLTLFSSPFQCTLWSTFTCS